MFRYIIIFIFALALMGASKEVDELKAQIVALQGSAPAVVVIENGNAKP